MATAFSPPRACSTLLRHPGRARDVPLMSFTALSYGIAGSRQMLLTAGVTYLALSKIQSKPPLLSPTEQSGRRIGAKTHVLGPSCCHFASSSRRDRRVYTHAVLEYASEQLL